MGIEVGRGKLPAMSSSASGAPWPRLAHDEGLSKKPCSLARSVHQITPVEAREASKPACGRWPAWAHRNSRWVSDFFSVTLSFKVSGLNYLIDRVLGATRGACHGQSEGRGARAGDNLTDCAVVGEEIKRVSNKVIRQGKILPFGESSFLVEAPLTPSPSVTSPSGRTSPGRRILMRRPENDIVIAIHKQTLFIFKHTPLVFAQ